MATPLAGVRDGGVLPAMAATASAEEEASWEESLADSPILIFLFFHKAIRAEMDGLHRAAVSFLHDLHGDMEPLLERHRFLRTIYKHHCNAEDEVRGSLSFLRNPEFYSRLS